MFGVVFGFNYIYMLLRILAEEDGSSWDVVSEDDLISGGMEDDDYVVLREEDITDAIASFMVTYLSSLDQTKVPYLITSLSFYVSRQLYHVKI